MYPINLPLATTYHPFAYGFFLATNGAATTEQELGRHYFYRTAPPKKKRSLPRRFSGTQCSLLSPTAARDRFTLTTTPRRKGNLFTPKKPKKTKHLPAGRKRMEMEVNFPTREEHDGGTLLQLDCAAVYCAKLPWQMHSHDIVNRAPSQHAQEAERTRAAAQMFRETT